MSGVANLVRRSGVRLEISVQATRINITARTGTMQQGESVTGPGITAARFLFSDPTHIFLYGVVGTATAGTLTGATSLATVTVPASPMQTVAMWTPYVRVARPKGSISASDSRGVTTVNDFDTAEDAFFAKITDGRDGSLSWTANLVMNDVGYELTRGAFEGNLLARLRRRRTTIDGLVIRTHDWEGFVSRADETENETGVSECSHEFQVARAGPFV